MLPPRRQAGYIGSHIVLKLVQAGYTVRACVRNAMDHEKVSHMQGCSLTSHFNSGRGPWGPPGPLGRTIT